MPAISDDLRTLILVLTTVCGAVFGLLLTGLHSNLWYFVRRLFPGERRKGGSRPAQKAPGLWVLFAVMGLLTLIGTVVYAVAPAGDETVPDVLDTVDQVPLLAEDFEDPDMYGFTVLAGDWERVEDETGNTVYEAENVGPDNQLWLGSFDPGDFALEYRIRYFSGSYVWLYFGGNLVREHTHDQLSITFPSVDEGGRISLLVFEYDGSAYDFHEVVGYSFNFEPGTWYLVRLQAQGQDLRVFLDGDLVIHTEQRLEPPRVFIFSVSGGRVQFDDITLYRLR